MNNILEQFLCKIDTEDNEIINILKYRYNFDILDDVLNNEESIDILKMLEDLFERVSELIGERYYEDEDEYLRNILFVALNPKRFFSTEELLETKEPSEKIKMVNKYIEMVYPVRNDQYMKIGDFIISKLNNQWITKDVRTLLNNAYKMLFNILDCYNIENINDKKEFFVKNRIKLESTGYLSYLVREMREIEENVHQTGTLDREIQKIAREKEKELYVQCIARNVMQLLQCDVYNKKLKFTRSYIGELYNEKNLKDALYKGYSQSCIRKILFGENVEGKRVTTPALCFTEYVAMYTTLFTRSERKRIIQGFYQLIYDIVLFDEKAEIKLNQTSERVDLSDEFKVLEDIVGKIMELDGSEESTIELQEKISNSYDAINKICENCFNVEESESEKHTLFTPKKYMVLNKAFSKLINGYNDKKIVIRKLYQIIYENMLIIYEDKQTNKRLKEKEFNVLESVMSKIIEIGDDYISLYDIIEEYYEQLYRIVFSYFKERNDEVCDVQFKLLKICFLSINQLDKEEVCYDEIRKIMNIYKVIEQYISISKTSDVKIDEESKDDLSETLRKVIINVAEEMVINNQKSEKKINAVINENYDEIKKGVEKHFEGRELELQRANFNLLSTRISEAYNQLIHYFSNKDNFKKNHLQEWEYEIFLYESKYMIERIYGVNTISSIIKKGFDDMKSSKVADSMKLQNYYLREVFLRMKVSEEDFYGYVNYESEFFYPLLMCISQYVIYRYMERKADNGNITPEIKKVQ